MNTEHGTYKCKKCDTVVATCRCPENHKIILIVCDDCKKKQAKAKGGK